MTQGREDLGQDDVENLLRQAAGDAPNPPSTSPLGDASSSAAGKTQDPAASGVASDTNPVDDIQLLLEQAEEAIRSVDDPVNPPSANVSPFQFRELAGTPASTEKATLELLRDVELDVKIELGRTHMQLEDVLRLRRGSVVALDKLAGDPVDIYANGRLIARGEVLVLNDNFCVRVAELISTNEKKT